MSPHFILTMLKTLETFPTTEICLTFYKIDQTPAINVCYVDKYFKVSCLRTCTSKYYRDKSSALSAINRALDPQVQESSA